MATAMERKFTGLRKRLDQLGYRQPLGVESFPLVERLVADLLHTTESLKICKLQVVKNKEQKGLWQQHVQPYRHDNARLTQENLELHQKLMKVKESSEVRNKDLKIALRKLEHENTDLKFLNTQYMQKLLAKEKESQAKSDRILQLQEKNSEAVVHTPGGRKKQIAFRRQRMDIDSTLAEAGRRPAAMMPVPEPFVADLVKVADSNIASLRNEIVLRQKEKEQLLGSIEDLTKQVTRREKEIERLSEQLKGGRPPEALATEGKRDGNERMVAHLNIQVDFLQKANMELEKQLADEKSSSVRLKGRVDELSTKNSHICNELQEIGELVKEMEKERRESELKLKDEVSEWKTKLQELQTQQKLKDKETFDKIKSCDELLSDNQQMARLLATVQGETEDATHVIETLSRENKHIKKQLYQTERKLKSRIATLEASTAKGRISPGEIASVHRERDELKEAVKDIEVQLIQIQEEAKSLTLDRDNFKILYEQVLSNISTTGSRGNPCRTTNHLEEGRDDAVLEIQQLRLECDSLRKRLRLAKESKGRAKETELEKVAEISNAMEKISHERNDLSRHTATLKQLNQQLEEELRECQSSLTEALDEVKELKGKLHTLQGLLDAAERSKSEHQRDQQELVGAAEVQAVSSEATQREVARLNTLVHQLEEGVKQGKEKEKGLTESLKQLDSEYDRLRVDCDKKDESIVQLKEEKNALSNECLQLKMGLQKLSHVESTTKIQLQSKDNEITRVRQSLSAKEERTVVLETQTQELERQLIQMKEDLTTMTQESQVVHAELRTAVQERDTIRQAIEDYKNKFLKYEELLTAKEQERSSLLESYEAISAEVERLDQTVRQSRVQESSYHLELSNLQKEKQQLEELCQQQATEIEQHIATLNSYEIQLSNLTNAMSRMEQNIRQEQEEKKALLIDLGSVRELCVQIEKTKESLARQLASQTVAHDQTTIDIADVTAERDLLRQQLTTEQDKVNNLEALLSHQRKKEFKSEVSDNERNIEIQHLKQQIAHLETDNVSHKEQVHKLRRDINIKGEELDRLKAELTAEKFQKQHIQEQVKKLRTAIGDKTTPPRHTPSGGVQPQLDEAIQKSKENISSESARLVEQLISST